MVRVSDSELADFLIEHIDNPCQLEIKPGWTENIRSFYLREAERALKTMTDPAAKDRLQKKVNFYWSK